MNDFISSDLPDLLTPVMTLMSGVPFRRLILSRYSFLSIVFMFITLSKLQVFLFFESGFIMVKTGNQVVFGISGIKANNSQRLSAVPIDSRVKVSLILKTSQRNCRGMLRW